MWTKIFLLFFVFSFLFKTDHSFDQDLGRHLKLGEIILKTGSIPSINLFSYTNPNFPFINTHWLFEVLAYLAQQTIGLQAFLTIKVVVLLISVWLLLRIIPKENHGFLLPIGFIFFHVLRERTELRPEIFSFFFTASTYYILEKYLRSSTKLIFLLPFIQLTWINTHIYFFVGLGIQAIFLIHLAYLNLRFHLEKARFKLLLLVLLVSAVLGLVNPNGITGFRYPLDVSKNYGYTIVENQTMFLLESIKFGDPNFLFVKLALAIAALSLVITAIKKRVVVKDILLLGFGATLALLNIRSFPYLVFLSFPALLANFGPIKYTGMVKVLAFFFGVLLISESYFYLSGDYYRGKDESSTAGLKLVESGKQALDFVINSDLPGPIYNNFDIGSYISFRGYPRYLVFVDGRPEAYPREFFSEIYMPSQSDYSKFKDLGGKFGFQTIIFSHTDQTPWGKAFLQSVVKDKDFVTVYLDDFMIVLVKKGIAEEKNLKAVDINALSSLNLKFENPRSYLNLSIFALYTGNQEAALRFTTSALSLFPESPVANSLYSSLTGRQFSPVYSAAKKFFW